MAEKNFAITPTVSISRSKFLRTNNHKTSFNLGEIVPIYIDEVLPGDTRSIDVASLVRMSTPIAPIMDDIEMEIFAFYVPNRLVWVDWKQFIGESPTAGFSAWNGTFPYIELGRSPKAANVLGSYLGLPIGTSSINHKISALPLRAYLSIYNRWFRDQNVESPCYVDTSDGVDASTDNVGVAYTYGSNLLIAYKKSDYFTRALPYAQKGQPVSLPLGITAPIIAGDFTSSLGTGKKLMLGFDSVPDGNVSRLIVGHGPGGKIGFVYNENTEDNVLAGTSAINSTNLLADLSSATAATINQLREAFQLQKLLEKDALYGTRYWEILYGHFSVRAPDASLQDPEYLGGIKFMINVEQVNQTSETATSPLGTPGANSVTGNKGSLFTKSFVEHGQLMILAVARQRAHTYAQGIMPMWQRFDRYDYYWPEFANLGAQEIKKKALYALGSDAEATFGYQEAWADYRYKPSIVSGLLNPAAANSLSYWTLADNFGSTPTLSASFLKESRANLVRALTTGLSGPDFIADFYFRDIAVRPMPLYSIPGLVDHH